MGCDDHRRLTCHRRRVATATERPGRSWGGNSSTTIASHIPFCFESRRLSIAANDDYHENPESAEDETDATGSIAEGMSNGADEFLQKENGTNNNGNETVDFLNKQTERLLRLLNPDNEGDTATASERSKLDLMEIDSIFEGWSRIHETSASDGMYAAESAESILVALEENYDRCWHTHTKR